MRQFIKSLVPDIMLNKLSAYKKALRKKEIDRILNGNDVHCPICNSSYKVFRTFGLVKRTNAECYNCRSLERHRLLFLYFQEKLNLFDGLKKPIKLLHFAPERIFYDKFCRNNNIIYTPCDLYPEAYKYDGPVDILNVDITNIPFDDNYFDVIICSHVLEHIPDDHLAMSELYRVLKKEGCGILQVPIDYSREKTYEDFSITDPKEREIAFGQYDHVRWYGKDYPDRLKLVGFKVLEDNFASTFSENDIFKYGLVKGEIIYRCNK